MSDFEKQSEPSGGSGTMTTVGTKVAKKLKEPGRKVKQLPPYRVLLHNDEVNTIEHVILSIVNLTSLTPDEAIQRTLEAHESGLALLLVTHKERAELYQDQFASVSLTVSIEPA